MVEHEPDGKLLAALGDISKVLERWGAPPRFHRSAGCVECRGRGYLGRVAIVEMLQLDDELRWMVVGNASPQKLREAAQARGMTTLREAGVEKALGAETTLEEVLRVCLSD
jgi:type II secretory ATPase GspE/PulE/Tfp pilus assembly ATPase PilB-like protein